MNQITVAIDASRNRSGGTKAHLIGILNAVSPLDHGINEIHLWSYKELLDQIPDYPWLVKHCPPALNFGLVRQVWWQLTQFSSEIKASGCHVLLSTDAGTVCHYDPDVVMSRDMLSFENGEMQRYPLFTFSRFRLLLLKWMQIRSLKRARGALFLTQYAADVIQKFSGQLRQYRVIPHGVSDDFRRCEPVTKLADENMPIRCTYVSNADLYKHQWNVIEAISKLRQSGHNISLDLVGAGSGSAVGMVQEAIQKFDPQHNFVSIYPNQQHEMIVEYLKETDIFIFASSCENMPNTLVEAMAAGLPITCSDRGPMPEVLGTAGVYFNPENPQSIASAISLIIGDASLRQELANSAAKRAELYSWRRCAKETWDYLRYINNSVRS